MDYQECDERYYFKGQEYHCSLVLMMELIGGKLKTLLLFHLEDGALRSGELQRTLKDISNKIFTQTARNLEMAGIIERIIYPVVPPKVEYRLTDFITNCKRIGSMGHRNWQ